jgi:uncharacterized C2H2 Zn-finger protein
LAKQLLLECHGVLKQRKDYRHIEWDCEFKQTTIWLSLFVELYQATKDYLRRINADALYKLSHQNGDAHLLSLSDIIDLTRQGCEQPI